METTKPKPPKSERFRALLPDIWALVKPRRGILLIGFVLMAINRVCGLVLPLSTKFLIDDIIGKRRTDLLLPLVLTVVTATLIQGVTSFSLTQLLSKAAQRLGRLVAGNSEQATMMARGRAAWIKALESGSF